MKVRRRWSISTVDSAAESMRRIPAVMLCVAMSACNSTRTAPSGEPVVITGVDTLLTTESGAIAYAVDLDVGTSGHVYVADYRADQILRVNPSSGEILRIGRRGAGPGELNGPWAVRATADELFVTDRGNGRMQRLTATGDYLSSAPVTPMVLRALPYITPDGGLVVSSGGRDSCLAILFDASSNIVRRIGTPVAEPPAIADFRAIKAAIRSGEIPSDLRNEALVAADSRGTVWVVLQTEAEVRRYDAEGGLVWSVRIDEPELETALGEFYQRNAAEDNPAAFYSLRYFRDLSLVGDELWLLLDTPADDAAVILVVGDGRVENRIEIPGAGGAASMAVDAERKALFLFTGEDAQLLAAKLPGEVVARVPTS